MTKKISLEIYEVMLAPTLEYCSFYTGSADSGELLKLQRMQTHACLRTSVRTIGVTELHTQAGIELVERRPKIQLLMIMWKKRHGGEAIDQLSVRTRGDLKTRF